jgi:hypothetical protein
MPAGQPAEGATIRAVTDTPPPPRFAAYIAGMDELAARTERLCAGQPTQDRVRAALLEAEEVADETGGWGMPPVLFFLRRENSTSEVEVEPLMVLSRLIAFASDRPSVALERLADRSEWVRHQVQLPEEQLHSYLRGLDAHEAEWFDHVRRQPVEDLLAFDIQPGWTFHGLGLICENWFAQVPDDPDAATIFYDMARKGMLRRRPDSVLTRRIDYVGRDGWMWEVSRFRPTGDITIPRYCVVRNHDSSAPIFGTVPHALSRMCNAFASNPVPIVPPVEPPR